jgi:hypothetical protein
MLAFFPWATVTERLSFGRFHIVPCAEALASSAAAPHSDAVAAILLSYGKRRPVDRAKIPVLVASIDAPFADLGDDDVGAFFDFRLRLTFASLAARRFFGLRYHNSDSLRLVIQGFTPGGSGTALIVTRRRDGQTRNIVSKEMARVDRPHHVPWCELPQDLDSECLRAIEAAAFEDDESSTRLRDAIQGFVGANTDSPEISARTELVDSVGAFSRLFGVWNEKATVAAFVETLPENPDPDPSLYGPRVTRDPLSKMLLSGLTIREAWLADAYRLRSQYGHGHVGDSPYRSAWTLEEHLLLAAYAFPLTVKAFLARRGHYGWTQDDQTYSDALDALATLDMFSTPTSGDGSDPWTRMLSRFEMRPLVAELARSLQEAVERDQAEGTSVDQAQGDTQ